MKLSEALLRRKELQGKIAVLATIKATALFEVKAVRKNVTDNIDDVVVSVPKLEANQVTAEYDYYSKQLRIVDAVIQQANWTTEVTTPQDVMTDFAEAQQKKAASLQKTA